MNPLNINDIIKFELIELKKGDKFDLSGIQIITVVYGEIRERIKGTIKTFESSTFRGGDSFFAEKDTLLTVFNVGELNIIKNKIDVNLKFGDFCRNNWKQLRALYNVEGFEKVDLYRGDQVERVFNGKKYKFNLWFCGPNVDCLFHNMHDFIEIHTNLAGDGFMEKALTGNNDGEDEIIEYVHLGVGQSHRKFNIEGEYEENGNPKYPFHRWLGGKTGNIWLVIEKY